MVTWHKEEYATTVTYRMLLAANKFNSWTETRCIAVNKDKSSSILLTLSQSKKAGTITLAGKPLKEDEEATYLGVIFENRQTWKPHIVKAEAKARRRLVILCKRAGTTCGASEKILKTVYKGTAWSTTADASQQTPDKIQNQVFHLITGATRSTSITEMERLT